MTGMRLLVDGQEIARHNGPLFDHQRRVTHGTASWWLYTTMRTVLPRRFEVEFIDFYPGQRNYTAAQFGFMDAKVRARRPLPEAPRG